MKYAVVIDAGSSGSRAFVYTWPDPKTYLDGMSPDAMLRNALLPIETMQLWISKVNPGISSFRGETRRIWKDHVYPLLQKAWQTVPKEEQHETPIFFLATAGLRLLPEEDQAEILGEVCNLLQTKSGFLVPECQSHVTMIDGPTEGIYGWLALNYLIHWSLSKSWHDFEDTYGFLDMGGASAQLAFASSPESEHKNDLHNVRIRTASGTPVEWSIFVTTWLGFGANQARARFWESLVAELSSEEIAEYESLNTAIPILDPCLPLGATEIDNTTSEKHCIFQGTGDWHECARRVGQLLNDDVACNDSPCLFNGVHVPDFSPDRSKFVGVSEYWYTLQDIFRHNGKFDVTSLEHDVAELCSSEWTVIQSKIANGTYTRGDGLPLEEQDVRRACFKSAWVLTVLHRGFQFPLLPEHPGPAHDFKENFQSAMEIGGTEISWTLGRAVLYASAQIAPRQGTEDLMVGITGLDGTFYEGGDSRAMLQLSSSAARGHGMVLWFWFLVLIALVALLLRLTPLAQWLSRSQAGKRLRRAVSHWVPSAEQQFQARTASRIGYGHSYPHAGVPLSDLDVYPHEAVSSSRPQARAPSRVGSRLSLNGHED